MWRGICYGIFYAIENYGIYLDANHNIVGFKTMKKGDEMVAKNVEPIFRPMGFDLHEGGGQVGALNSHWFVQFVFFMHFVRVSIVISLVFVLVWREVSCPGGICTYHVEQPYFP